MGFLGAVFFILVILSLFIRLNSKCSIIIAILNILTINYERAERSNNKKS